MAHAAVREASGDRDADERWGERPLACVVLEDGAAVTAGDLLEHLRPRVAHFWLPDEFAFLEAIPKTSVGKFDKKLLRARLEQDALAGRVRVTEQS